VIMLSGTPAFSKPFELYPQLSALLEHMWIGEDDYIKKYCQGGKDNDKLTGGDKDGDNNNSIRDPNLAELHTMLTSTVMIRRTKAEVLKNLPGKVRESALVKVRDVELGQEITESMHELRKSQGVLGRLSRMHHATDKTESSNQEIIIPDTTRPPPPPPQYVGNGNSVGTEAIVPINEEKKSRKAMLGHIFKITGYAKIPVIVDMLDKFLNDPTSGKLCIFAHHIHVIDSLVKHVKHEGHKYMSITGSTPPQVRQDNIVRFQTDPSLRVAILGITAAGVGVTLTAASTIWFAELFWTPAILIQAEDRCHRIGQQAKVHCLYLIAKGTLDEILWLLVKKKFRDLGEFVEGKEKLDIVVHRQYEDEWSAIDRVCGTNDKDDDISVDEVDDDFGKMNDGDLIEHDMEEMANEEQAMVKRNSEDDDDDIIDATSEDFFGSGPLEKSQPLDKIHRQESVPVTVNVGMGATESVPGTVNVEMGATEANADFPGKSDNCVICLSDDDEVEHVHNGKKQPEIRDIIKSFGFKPKEETIRAGLPVAVLFPNMQFYNVTFNGPTYGLALANFSGRVVVQKPPSNEIDVSPGSVIAAINSHIVPHNTKFQDIMNMLKYAINRSPAVITFAQDKEFELFWLKVLKPCLETIKMKLQKQKPIHTKLENNNTNVQSEVNHAQFSNKENASNVIELLDDD